MCYLIVIPFVVDDIKDIVMVVTYSYKAQDMDRMDKFFAKC